MTTRARRNEQLQSGTSRGPRQASGLEENGPLPGGSVIELPGAIAVNQLAELMGKDPIEVIKQLMRNGIMANINQVVEYDSAATVARDFGYKPKNLVEVVARPSASVGPDEEDDPSQLQTRPPVVTVLGHVDHGKTTLLDAIRKTNVVASEAGGITQHIGAYKVAYKGQHHVTFIDTPGHEAFTAMRARGSRVTDIAVLVVAADDGIMPQTVEAIDHAKAAAVPIVVAINKIDRPNADADKVKRQLAERELLVEDWGGDVIAVPVSAKEETGIDDLLENILVVAEIAELKANPNRPATGVVVEARVDKSRGPMATILVQKGTLKVGDNLVVGEKLGRIRAMLNHAGQLVKKAEPSTPVEVLGIGEVPAAGDTFVVMPDEKSAKELLQERLSQRRGARSSATTLEEVYSRIESGEVKELSLVIKTDVQGSVDAVKGSLERLSTEQAKVKIVRIASGSITESDVLLAVASQAIIIGFNTRLEPSAANLAELESVEIRFYTIIYKLVEDIEKAVAGLLEPERQEVVEGHAEVRAVFSLGRRYKIAGVYVNDGKITRNSSVRISRGRQVISEGRVSSLKRFKDDVREVSAGYECGVAVENFTDFNEGDTLEIYAIR